MLQRSKELIREKWHSELHIYTDGSLVLNKNLASAAFWVPAFSYKQHKRLAHASSSMKAELAAISLALTWIDQLNLYTGAVLFSDSLSGLMAIQNSIEDTFVDEILTQTTHLRQKNINIYFEWIPAHCGLRHNETVDYYAKAGLSGPVDIFNRPSFTGEKTKITQNTNNAWQKRWETNHSPLRELQPLVPSLYPLSLNRNQESIIHRLRLGTMGLNEDLLKLGQHENGHCTLCPALETVNHYLTSCPQYIIPRAMLLTETNLPESESHLIISLLKSKSPDTQRALVRFVHRTKRVPAW